MSYLHVRFNTVNNVPLMQKCKKLTSTIIDIKYKIFDKTRVAKFMER